MILLNVIKPTTSKIFSQILPQIKIHKVKLFKILIGLGLGGVLYYFLFSCPSTRLTQDRLINVLSQRNPPNWLVPSQPGESVDIELTKNYKRLKLTEFKKKTNALQVDLKKVWGKGQDLNLAEENTGNESSWLILRDDFSAVTSTLIEFWGITVVTVPSQDPNQDQPQKMIVGEGSQPINLDDRVLRWQKEIETAAEKYDLEPALLAAVIEQESGGEPEALSPVGAIGLMQLMPSTAELMGVNPYDPTQNIEGGTRYLKQQLDSFGNLQAALAAYNAGPGSVENGSWVNIPETMNYVRKVPLRIEKYKRIWRDNQGRV